MKKLIIFAANVSLIFAFFLCTNNFVNAANSQIAWKEKFSTKQIGKYLNTKNEFDAYSVEIPPNTEILAQTNLDEFWTQLVNDEDYPDEKLSELVFVKDGLANQIRFRIEGEVIPEYIVINFINSKISAAKPLVAERGSIGGLKIISRSEWGANESLRFYDDDNGTGDDVEEKEAGEISSTNRAELCGVLKNIHPEEFEIASIQKTEGGKKLLWPLQYSSRVFKVVLHHTAETGVENGRKPDEVMRSIYAYHARSRGWGDIGYNFVIDPYGNIYEGRAGGDFTIGGHVYCNNIGTIGIALMGNFQDQEINNDQLIALGKLLPRLAAIYELDLTASEEFHGKITANLIGHRDIAPTACPGQNFYNIIPDLRKILAGTAEIILAKSIKYEAEIADKISVIEMTAGTKKQIKLRFKNTGTVVWDKSTWLYAFQPKSGGVYVQPAAGQRKYVAAKMNENRVSPGEIGTFDVNLETEYRGGLFTIEFAPVIKNKKATTGAIIQPIKIPIPDWGAKVNTFGTLPKTPFPNDRVSATIYLKNTGNTVWKKDFVTLSIFSGRLREDLEVSLNENVAPGKIGKFHFSLDPFTKSGKQALIFRLLLSGVRMPGIPPFVETINVQSKNLTANFANNKALTFVENGQKAVAQIKVINTGNVNWQKEDVKLQIFGIGKREEINFNENEVIAGDIATFNLEFTPASTGSFRFTLVLKASGEKIVENIQWIVNSLTRVPDSLKNRGTISVEKKVITKEVVADLPVVTTGDIRIRLGFDNNYAKITGSGDFDIYADGKKLSSLKKGEQVELLQKTNSIYIRNFAREFNVIKIVPQDKNAFLEVLNWERYSAWDTNRKYNDNKFFGNLETRIYNGEFVLINELPLESYISGIAEAPDSDHSEKKKVMAILSRTYAYFYLQPENTKFPGAPYDGSDSPAEFQKYLGKGFTDRSSLWQQAANETKGLVVTYKGEAVKTPYFHQSDGKTRTMKEAWNMADLPYLVSVPDPYCNGMERQGHGVGLSGIGANEAAKNGKTYEEIIKYYYKGVEIQKID